MAYLDRGHPSHKTAAWLSDRAVAMNPTIVHEAYHSLVFKMRWGKEEASKALTEAITDERNLFINQTLRTTRVGLRIAVDHSLGGKDALILGGFVTSGVRRFLTLDRLLLGLKSIDYGQLRLEIGSP